MSRIMQEKMLQERDKLMVERGIDAAAAMKLLRRQNPALCDAANKEATENAQHPDLQR